MNKFNILDEVYYINNSKVKKGKIIGVAAITTTDTTMYPIVEVKAPLVIINFKYTIFNETELLKNIILAEENVFKTKEELIQSL